MFEQANINQRIGFCNTRSLDEVQNCRRRITAAAQTAQSGHTRVVPALYMVFKHQLTQIALGHNRIGHIQAGKFALLGVVRQRAVVHNPLIQRAMVFKLNRAHRMCNAFQCILNGVCEVIQRINAPLVPLSVVMGAHNAVNGRVAHVHVGRSHVNLGAQRLRAIRELARAHILKQLQVLLYRAVTVRAVFARLGQRTAIFTDFVLCQVADIGLTRLDERNRAVIAGFKVVRAVENAAVGHFAGQPLNVLLDRLYILVIFAHRIGVIKAQIELAAIFLGNRPVDINGFCRANVQIAIRLRRETGVDLLGQTGCNIGINDVGQEIFHFFHEFK